MRSDLVRVHPAFKEFLEDLIADTEMTTAQATYVTYMLLKTKFNHISSNDLKQVVKQAVKETTPKKYSFDPEL